MHVRLKKPEAETTEAPPPAEPGDWPSLPPTPSPELAKWTSYDWKGSTREVRVAYYNQIDILYRAILNEFLAESNSCVERVEEAKRSYTRWRLTLIITTGGLAIVNLLAAYASTTTDGNTTWDFLKTSLPLFAAVYAAVLAIATNLESFYNFPVKAQAYRESRDLFLDAYREFELLWQLRVRPFYPRPETCVNAAEVYLALVQRDRDLRRKLKELTSRKDERPEVKPAPPGAEGK